MTVLPHPNAPGMAHVPPSTLGNMTSKTLCPVNRGWFAMSFSATGRGHRVRLRHAVNLELDDRVAQGVRVAVLGEPRDFPAAAEARRQHDAVRDEVVLRDDADDVPAGDVVADLESAAAVPSGRGRAMKLPRFVEIHARDVDPARDEAVPRDFRDRPQRALYPVEDVAHDPRAEIDAERPPRSKHGIADGQPGRLLVALYRRGIALETNDLSRERVAADAHELVHRRAVHVVRDDDGAGDFLHRAAFGLLVVAE
eukprot:31185-Pelagococcus_subviridis.AAC.5